MMLVWSRTVRAIHWSVALLVAANYFNEEGESWHRYGGYLIAALVLMRLLRGILRKDAAHFSTWPLRPRQIADYLRAWSGGEHPRYLGLNPLGALMAAALWLLLLALAVTGWMMGADAWWGEQWLQDLHAMLANTLLACIAVHILGVVVTSLVQKENLTRAMLTGKKREALK